MSEMDIVIGAADPRHPDIVAVLETHLRTMRVDTPAEFVFALDVDALCDPSITFVAARHDQGVLGVGALKRHDDDLGELKSMHTLAASRGLGVGAAIVEHLLGVARSIGLRRVSLETGSMASFAPAHRLYERAGFGECGPFADYPDVPTSRFMTLELRA